MNEYRGRCKLYHVDLYRLEDPGEVLALDLPGYTADGVLIVEWPERGEGLLPREHLLVQLEPTGESSRRITLSASGLRAELLLAGIGRNQAMVASPHA